MNRSKEALEQRRVLVVEDEYFIADDIATAVRRLGGEVIGPVGTCGEAIDLLRRTPSVDAAVLDVNLRGEMIFPVAEALQARGVPFVLGTGYEDSALPKSYQDVPRCQKPFDASEVARVLSELLSGPGR
jgi:CheY-like chemotaxis protein